MRNLIFAALAAFALVCASPASAATTTSRADPTTALTATLTAQDDAIRFTKYLGSKWGTVKWQVTTAGSGGITAQYSKDGGTNWLTAPYSVNISATSANPSTAPWVNNTPVVGTYETPLPGNATDFRITYATAGTSTAIVLMPGAPYVPGVIVKATLWDTTSAVNTAIDTGTLDVSGWAQLGHVVTDPAGGGGSVAPVDDAGNTLSSYVTFAASNTAIGGIGPGSSPGGTSSASFNSSPVPMPRRIRYQTNAVAALTSRVRVEATR